MEETVPFAQGSIKEASLQIRCGFIRKVYGILAAQLCITAAVAAPFQLVSARWLLDHVWVFYLSFALTFVTMLAMVCCQQVTRKFPQNYIMLFIFTVVEGVMIGFLSAMYTWQSVLLAAGITVLIFLSLTVFAWTTQTDFTGYGVYLYGALSSLCMFGLVICIMGLFGVHIRWMTILYDIIGVLIFVGYIVFDTQLILGEYGGHKIQFCIDDYVFASLNLYLDILNLFVHLLSLLGERRN